MKGMAPAMAAKTVNETGGGREGEREGGKEGGREGEERKGGRISEKFLMRLLLNEYCS